MSAVWRRFEAAVIFFGSFALAASVIKFKPFVEAGLANLGWLAYPLAILIFTAVASAPFSVTDALAVMNGVIFGPLWGSVVNAIGLVFAAMVGYKLARRTSHLLELHDHIEKLPPWVRRFKVGSPPFLLTLRIIPGLGGTMATQIAAAFRIPMWVHVWTMCAIAIPVCTLLAIFGDRVSESVSSYYQHSRMTERIRHMFHRRPRPSPSGVRIERAPESSTHREPRR
ncbi:MAG: VTT domain-containing protein [Candidatus Eremiobacteraeota bacterium]|nr:VTT domain-containing protein [Candidatus Eremiobacteraeota bacterium]